MGPRVIPRLQPLSVSGRTWWSNGRSETQRAARRVASPDKRDKQAEAANATRLDEIDMRIAEIDKHLAKDFPGHAALASPKPLSIADVQSQLQDSEALVLFLDTPEAKPTPEETFIWSSPKPTPAG